MYRLYVFRTAAHLGVSRYMHQHTLGCPHTFEFRRQELSIILGKDQSQATYCLCHLA